MQARQGEGDSPYLLPLLVIVGDGAISIELHRQSGVIRCLDVLNRPTGIGLEVFAENRIVLIDEQAFAAAAEGFHRLDQIVEIAVMVRMVQFKIGDDPQAGLELHQRSIGFVCLSDKQTTVAGVPVAAVAGDNTTNHSGWIFTNRGEECGHHSACGCFSMATRNSDGGLLFDQPGQKVRAMPNR